MSKLDKILTDIDEAFGTMLKWFLIVGIPVEVVEQICIAAQHRPHGFLPVLTMMLVVAAIMSIKELEEKR